eukprot:17801-Heterococcus_DN1.PRE.3
MLTVTSVHVVLHYFNIVTIDVACMMLLLLTVYTCTARASSTSCLAFTAVLSPTKKSSNSAYTTSQQYSYMT